MADAKHFAEWCERHDMNPAHSREAFDDAATLHLLDRATPSPPVAAPPATPGYWRDDQVLRFARWVVNHQHPPGRTMEANLQAFRDNQAARGFDVPAAAQPQPQPAQPLTGAPQCGGVPDPRCNYLATCGRVCMKCGRVHAPHLFSLPPPARWGSFEAAMADPVFQTARSIMGTENEGQDRQLLKAINHTITAPSTPTPPEAAP